MGNSSWSSEDHNAKRNANSALKVLEGMKALLGTGVETTCVIFWQRACLYLAHVLRLCVRLNLKVMD